MHEEHLEDHDLPDALAERALRRTGSAATVGGFALGALALVFLVLAGGSLDVTSAPQILILGLGQVCGLVLGCVAVLTAHRARSRPGSGPALAQQVARLTGRAIRITCALVGLVAGWALLTQRPLVPAALSVAVGVALISQFLLVLHVQRRGLSRAGPR